MYYYIINDNDEIVVEPDVLKWAKWFESSPKRVVARDKINEYFISTVFLGLDHSFGGDKPILYETMVFGKNDRVIDHYTNRYETREQALKRHQDIIDEINKLR